MSYATISSYEDVETEMKKVDLSRTTYLTVRDCGFSDEYYLHNDLISFGTHETDIDVWLNVCPLHVSKYEGDVKPNHYYVHFKSLNWECCHCITVLLSGDPEEFCFIVSKLLVGLECYFCTATSITNTTS